MAREMFDQEMQRIQDEAVVLGSLAEAAITNSVRYLKGRDHEKARDLIEDDERLNEKRYAIERDIVALIATQQPVASDLRVLIALLDITAELERIGDYAKGIAKVSILIGDEPLMKPLVDIPRMADVVCRMLHQALESFFEQNLDLAQAVPDLDDEVDALYNQIYRELMTYVIANPKVIEQSNLLLWVAHNLERAGDRAINICERVVFTVTGQLEEMASHSNEIVEGRMPQ